VGNEKKKLIKAPAATATSSTRASDPSVCQVRNLTIVVVVFCTANITVTPINIKARKRNICIEALLMLGFE
jgi:hypothetical protein